MCFPFDAQPPIEPVRGAAVDSEDLTLESADGTEFAAFVARAKDGTGTGIVVLTDVRGLYRFYEELALRLAEEGINAIAIDYFGRSAGVAKRDESFPYMDHVRLTRSASVAADVAAAVAYLRSPEGGACRSIFTVGFCFGGSNSWLQAANGHSLAGVIGFYGRPGPGFDGSPGPVQRAREFTCPVLALMGGADPSIPREDIEELQRAFNNAGIPNEVVVYPGAPHSFFDRSYERYASECADAWQRVLSFVRKYSEPRSESAA